MSEKKKPTATAPKHPRKPTRTPAVPWIEDGIDYGPAILAIEELVAWAFHLAAASVEDSPEGKRRVKNARRFVTASIRGKRTPSNAEADVVFTASLLIRILDADMRLGLGDIVSVLSELGLPTYDVPNPPRRAARVARPAAADVSTAELAAVLAAMRRGVSPVAVPSPVVPLRRPTRGAIASACAACPFARPGLAIAA